MEYVLFCAHVEADGSLARTALETLRVAAALAAALGGAKLGVGLIGEKVQNAANQIAGIGADRFLAVIGPEFIPARYATDAAAAEAIARAAQATIILVPGTARWSRVLAGVAHRLAGRADTHITAIAVKGGALAATRWFYRQRMEAVFTRTERPWCFTIEPGSQEPWSGPAGNATLETIPVSLAAPAQRTVVQGVQSPPADAQTIRPDAKLLFVAGGGWSKKQADGQTHAGEAHQLILDFLRASQASLGGTKSLVDMSGEGQAVLPFMTHLNQVGQTGSTPRHP
jgi:electron transfer flavoprotein alpha subunit